ncbi:MAG: hypothetical protein HQL39_05495, partial [Alphaproteobacteria bacterium]|nr:hypothetical protein [Alphaproteobacteria bacterium]
MTSTDSIDGFGIDIAPFDAATGLAGDVAFDHRHDRALAQHGPGVPYNSAGAVKDNPGLGFVV